MPLSRLGGTAATQTRHRVASVSPFSGLCVTCVAGCIGLCEVGKSAIRGSEVLYPQPYGEITAGAEKDYPVDLSHLNIMGTAVGAVGVEASSEAAVFPSVDLHVSFGQHGKIDCALPIIIPGLGSTDVARKHWDELAIGAAASGVPLTIGENVCGMDDQAEMKNGRIGRSPDMEHRIKIYRRWQRDHLGEIIVQSNVEDTSLGVLEYALQDLGVETVELKWGQGAKNIGGEVKIDSLHKAQRLFDRGYIVLPDPTLPEVVDAFRKGHFKEFERHSRLGMVSEEDFARRVEELRELGAKRVFLKTGAYRPVDLARAVRFASDLKIDLLTVDGAGGGTGMSPWRMMNEWGVPSLELWSLTRQYCERVEAAGGHPPVVAFAGGITLEDQIFKALALGAPYAKLVGMARAPITAAMVGKTVGEQIRNGSLAAQYKQYGATLEEVFIGTLALRSLYPRTFDDIPPGAIGVFTYFERLAQGLRQLMAGTRKFALRYLDRSDLAALTRQAAEVTGVAYVMEQDHEEVERILRPNTLCPEARRAGGKREKRWRADSVTERS